MTHRERNDQQRGPECLSPQRVFPGGGAGGERQQHPIAELSPQSSVLRSYLWGPDLSGTWQGAGGVGGLLEVNDAANGVHFACYDGNGSVIALVNAAYGNATTRYEYGPFGEVIRATGPIAALNHMRWSSKYTDDETDLVYYGYRYYSPSLGRWLSRDPMGENGGLSLHAFLGNDPEDNIDFLGGFRWYNPYSWIYDPEQYVYYPPLPLPHRLPPPSDPSFQQDIDS